MSAVCVAARPFAASIAACCCFAAAPDFAMYDSTAGCFTEATSSFSSASQSSEASPGRFAAACAASSA
ncbi:MAG TPA: hypothetical protein VFB93_04175, partial [Burkholderiales bacterium]|nr:hypothetical protein [Burkholderiales bacterium]